MSVIGFARPRINRRGSAQQDKEAGSVREYQREFIVHTDNRYDGPITVLGAPGLPQLYFPYITLDEEDFFALCTRVEAAPLSDKMPFAWLVTADYSTKHEDEKKDEHQDDPLARPAEVSFDGESYRVPVTGALDEEAVNNLSQNPEFMDPKNVNGQAPPGIPFKKAILNSAGEPFDPPAEKDESRPVLTIARNEAFFNPMLATAFQDAVNSDKFLGAQPRQAKIKSISAHRQQEGNLRFWKVTYTIVFKRDLWDLQLLDHGSYYFDPTIMTLGTLLTDAQIIANAQAEEQAVLDTAGTIAQSIEAYNDAIVAGHKHNDQVAAGTIESTTTGGGKKPFLDDDGNRITGLLNGDIKTGVRLPKGADPKYLSFRVYAELPFSILQLPQAIRA